jgi:hypothetical protein
VSQSEKFWYGVYPSAACTCRSKPRYRPSESPATFGCNREWYRAV